MTTAAYANGILAFDGLCTDNGLVAASGLVKGIRTKNYLAAAAGCTAACQARLEWVRAGMPPDPLPPDDATLLVVDREGNISEYGAGCRVYRFGPLPFHAIGSGSAIAMGAMHAGATALEAVRIAAKLDIYTGGRIRTVSFK